MEEYSAMKYRPCVQCGKKPKAYKTDYGCWNIDHDCPEGPGVWLCTEDEWPYIVKHWNAMMDKIDSGQARLTVKEK